MWIVADVTLLVASLLALALFALLVSVTFLEEIRLRRGWKEYTRRDVLPDGDVWHRRTADRQRVR
jgi:hypothetical protein